MKLKITIYLKIFFLFLLTYNVSGQQDSLLLNKKISEVLTEIYRFQFTKYEKDIANLKAAHLPDNHFYYLKANLQWWYILNGENDEANQKLCLKYINRSIEAERQNENLEDKLTRLSAYILKMRVNNLEKNKIKSSLLLIKILNLSEMLISEMPESGRKNFIKGIYHYFTNYAKEESVLANILLYGYSDKNKETGLNFLKKATFDTDTVVRTEAHYLLYKIYATLEHDMQKALDYIKWLSETYPENIFFKTEYYLTLCHNRLFSEADIVKNNLLRQVALSTELNDKEKKHYYISATKCQSNTQND